MSDTPRTPFPFESRHRDFMLEFARSVRRDIEAQRSPVIPARNVSSFQHGIRWQLHQAETITNDISEMTENRAQAVLTKADIIACRLPALDAMRKQIATQLHEQLMKRFYAAINESTERSGNTVDARSMPAHEALLATMEKVEFAVDETGEPRVPEFHASPAAVDRFAKGLDTAPADFRPRLDAIIEKQKQQARLREAERRGRFVKPEE